MLWPAILPAHAHSSYLPGCLPLRRLMGRAASHVTLECALQTHPQLALICEEVAAHRWGLKDVVRQVRFGCDDVQPGPVCRGGPPCHVSALLVEVMGSPAHSTNCATKPCTRPNQYHQYAQVADMVAQRAELGKNFGVVLIPEGLVEFMHDVSELITGGYWAGGWDGFWLDGLECAPRVVRRRGLPFDGAAQHVLVGG